MDAVSPSKNLIAALRLAKAGLAIFPCKTNKSPLVKWRDESTSDVEVILYWWRQWWPESLPAVDNGKSGLLVVDLDKHPGQPDGETVFRSLAKRFGDPLQGMPVVATPRGGFHLYYRQHPEKLLGNAEGELTGKGINIRGDGGYVIAPGAETHDGRAWQQTENTPDLAEAYAAGFIPVIPDWLQRTIKTQKTPHAAANPEQTAQIESDPETERPYALAALHNETRKVEQAVEGTRNNTLNAAAFSLGTLVPNGGVTKEEVEAELTVAALGAGLEAKEIARTINSGIEKGMAQPRQSLTERNEILRETVTINLDEGGIQSKLSSNSALEWPDPKPLPSGLSPVDHFDPAFLPDCIAPWILDTAERMQCPPDYVAASAVVALGSVIGRQVGIRPKAKDDWTVVPNLWGMIIGPPGVMKSPAIEEALWPLKSLEGKARSAHQSELQSYRKDAQEFQLRHAAEKKRVKKVLEENLSAEVSIEWSEEPTAPRMRRYVTNDTTYEALGEILASNPNGTLAHRDEIISLLKTLDREENASARGFFLTGWNGSDGYTFDRITRGICHIEAVCLSVLGSTQPGRLINYFGRALRSGEGDDGMMQRFGLLVWPDQSAEWRYVDRLPDAAARGTALQTFERLANLQGLDLRAAFNASGRGPSLAFTPEANACFSEWLTNLERRLRSGEWHAALESHFAKYRKLVPALSLINHLADGGTEAVTLEALKRAIAFARYLESHAHRVYGSGLRMDAITAEAITVRIRKGHLRAPFTLRDIHQRDWSNLTDREQVQAGLDLLVDLDWLKEERTSTGGRPKIIYQINPKVPL